MEDQNRKLQLLRAGPREFAIFTDEISAIAEWREPTPLPHAPKSVLGVVSIEGRMLTVLDLATLSNSETGQGDDSKTYPKQIVSLRGDEQLALAVTALGDILAVSNSDFEKPDANEERLVGRILRREGVEIKVMNVKELFSIALQGRERRRRRF